MSDTSIDFDSARSILQTYQQISDNVSGKRKQMRSHLQQKTDALEKELHLLKEKYRSLQTELTRRDQDLVHLNRQLIDRTDYMKKLQEDYENAIYHLTKT